MIKEATCMPGYFFFHVYPLLGCLYLNKHYNPNSERVSCQRFKTYLCNNIGIITPETITIIVSGKNTYHKLLSNGNFLNTVFANPSNVV